MRLSTNHVIVAVSVLLVAGGARPAQADWTWGDHYVVWSSGSGTEWELESDGGISGSITLAGTSVVTDGGNAEVRRDFTYQSPGDPLSVLLYAEINGYAAVDAGQAGSAYCDIDGLADGTADFPNSRILDEGPLTASAPGGTATRSYSVALSLDPEGDRTAAIGGTTTLKAAVRAYTTGQRSGTGAGGGSASALVILQVL